MLMSIKLCRLCRSYENINSTLNHIDSDNLSLFQKLNKFAPGILDCNANLPNCICMNCITELNIAYKFINKCSESQVIFRRYLEQLQNRQDVQPSNNQEILIQVIKLEESNCTNSEVNSNNSITVKEEKEIEFSNEETNVAEFESNQVYFEDDIKIEEEDDIIHTLENIKKQNNENNYSLTPCEELQHVYDENSSEFSSVQDHSDLININKKETDFLNEESNFVVSDSDQITFEDYTKIEEDDEIRNILAQLETEDIDNNYYYENAIELSSVRDYDHSDSFNINNEYESIEVNDIKTDEDGFENNPVDLLTNAGHFTGFDLVQCNVANSYKVKYHLVQEMLAEEINKEHTKNVNKVLERSEIGQNSSNLNINIQAPNKCKIYNKTRKRRSNVSKHKRTRTGRKLDKPYQCAICGRATISKSKLKAHMYIHTNEKPFKCETCSKAFNDSSNLKQHIRIHTNEKPFKCETCKKTFNQSSNLIRHIRIHTNEKPFKCETCKKTFNQSSNLIRHIRIHTNEKPFKCETCKITFNQSSHLKRHIRIHSKEKQ